MSRQIATAPEKAFRKLCRELGFFQIEAVPFIRSQNGEHTAIVCFPSEDVAAAVQLLTDPRNGAVEITRIHIGADNGLNNGRVTARVYVGWTNEIWYR